MGHYVASKQTPTTQPLAPWAWPGEVEGGVLIDGNNASPPEVSILIGLHHSYPEFDWLAP